MGRFRANLFGASGQDEEDHDERQRQQEEEHLMQPYYANTYGERPPRRIYGVVIQSPLQDGDDDGHRNRTNGGRNFWDQTYQWPDEETSYQNENGPPRRSRFWYWVVVIALVAHLLTRYGPPAPPPLSAGEEEAHHEWTWSEFLSVEGSRLLSSVTSLSSILPYALKWCVVGVQDDVKGLVNDARQWHCEWKEERQRRQRPICDLSPLPSLQDDDENVIDSVESFFRKTIVGQEQAISAVSEALGAWDFMEETPDAISTTTAATRPLLLLLTGTTGVGKLELARQVAQLVFGHCSQTNGSRGMQQHQQIHEGVLLLHGEDFSSDKHSRNEHQEEEDLMMTTRFLQDNLYRQIGHHVQRQREAGAVVIIQHVEKMALQLLTTLCRDMTASAAATLSYPKDIIRHPGSLHAATYPDDIIETKLEKVIFIFTTDVGAGIIGQSIKYYGGIDNSPKLDLDLALRHELDAHFVGGEEHLEHDDKLVGSMVHVVAPFVPLGPSELERILHQKIEQLSLLKHRAALWKGLVMTRAAATALVDTKRVDYIRWKKRDSEENILVFSPSGAKLLENGSPIMNRIKSQTKRCFSVAQPNRVAVLDYDARERMALFCWCNEEESASSDDMEDACESCEEICRFSLLN